MKRGQKFVTVFIVLLFCVLVRASDGGGCMNMGVSERNACLRAQGDDAYNRAVDYFMRGSSYLNSSDRDRALQQLNLSMSSLREANLSYSNMEPSDPQQLARVDAAYLQASEKIASASGNTPQSTGMLSSTPSSTTLMMKVSTRPETSQRQDSPSGNQILLVAATVIVLSVVGFMFLKRSKK